MLQPHQKHLSRSRAKGRFLFVQKVYVMWQAFNGVSFREGGWREEIFELRCGGETTETT